MRPLCKWFQRGFCKFGSKCWYSHLASSPIYDRYHHVVIQETAQEIKCKFAHRWPDLQMYSPYKCKYPLPEPLVVYTFHEHFRDEKDLVITQDGVHFHDIARGKQELITEVDATFERYWEYSEEFPSHPLGFVWKQLRERDAAIDRYLDEEDYPKVIRTIISSYVQYEIVPIDAQFSGSGAYPLRHILKRVW